MHAPQHVESHITCAYGIITTWIKDLVFDGPTVISDRGTCEKKGIIGHYPLLRLSSVLDVERPPANWINFVSMRLLQFYLHRTPKQTNIEHHAH